jgi:tetratricopeptide (TPR) repeat protein
VLPVRANIREMANQSRKAKQPALWSEFSTPLLILAAFVLGAAGMWAIMYSSAPEKQAVQRFVPAPPPGSPSAPGTSEAPDVSQLPPASAARTLADWNYDRQNWTHAIEHYQEAIARGADNADVRTDLGSCFRFLGQAQKALEQYELAQKENPQHENSLFNQAGLYAEVLHDDDRALSVARDFISRFPQSPRAPAAKELINRLSEKRR